MVVAVCCGLVWCLVLTDCVWLLCGMRFAVAVGVLVAFVLCLLVLFGCLA